MVVTAVLALRTIRIVQNTKNQETITLPMNETVYRTLKRIKNKTGQYEYVFCHTRGRRPGTPIRDVKNSFSTACSEAGITDLRFHDLRHTFASWLVMNSVSLAAVQKLLGHKTIKMTLRYAHLAPGYLADEVKVLDKL